MTYNNTWTSRLIDWIGLGADLVKTASSTSSSIPPPPSHLCFTEGWSHCLRLPPRHLFFLLLLFFWGQGSGLWTVAWTKNPKLGVDGGKWCVYTKRMFWQNFRIFEKKLAEGSAFLVYNGICNGKNLQKPKIFILGTKTCLYELLCHPHIEDDQTKPICFMKKISLI